MKSKLNFKINHKNGNTFDMHEMGVWVSSFHIHSPNIQRKKTSVNGRNGSLPTSTRLGERNVDIECQIETQSMLELDDMKHLIYRMFYSTEEMEIVRDLTPDKSIFVVQEDDFDIENITCEDGEFGLTLTALDPLIYGAEHQTIALKKFTWEEYQGQTWEGLIDGYDD